MGQKLTLGSDVVKLTFSKIITLLVTMLTSMLLSRFRTFEEYGTYSQLLLVINLFSSLFMLGLPNCINYFLARAESDVERNKFLSVYYTLSTLLSFVVGLVLILSIPLIEACFENSIIHKFFYFLALYPWITIITSSIENILVVYKKTSFLMLFKLVMSIAILASVIVVQLLGYGFSEYMIVFTAVNCLFAVFVYLISNKLCDGIRISFNKEVVREIFVFSIPIGLAAVVSTLNTEIDKFLIGYLMNTEQLAIYTNAAKELPLTIVSASITAVLLPHLSKMIKQHKPKEAIALWSSASELSFILISVIVAGVFVYAPEAMTILYSAKYLPGVTVFRIYTLNLLLRITYFGMILNAYGETKKIFYCSILTLILNVILNPLFYWIFGMEGPAIATFLVILLMLILQLVMTSKITKVSFKNVFNWKQIFITFVINVCFAIIFYFIKIMIPINVYVGEITESILLGIIWGLLYLLAMKKRIKCLWKMLNSGGC